MDEKPINGGNASIDRRSFNEVIDTGNLSNCAICMEVMEPNEWLYYNGCCGNAVHFPCYQQCLNSNNTKCPTCLSHFTAFAPSNDELSFPPPPPVSAYAIDINSDVTSSDTVSSWSCIVCNEVLNLRGGVPIVTPSCGCGDRASMHFDSCYQQRLLHQESRCCPLCRTAFSAYLPINRFPRTPNIATPAVNVHFTNHLSGPVTTYWSSFEGVETFYATLDPQWQCRQPTYDGHIWIARMGVSDPNGRVVGYYIAKPNRDWSIGL